VAYGCRWKIAKRSCFHNFPFIAPTKTLAKIYANSEVTVVDGLIYISLSWMKILLTWSGVTLIAMWLYK